MAIWSLAVCTGTVGCAQNGRLGTKSGENVDLVSQIALLRKTTGLEQLYARTHAYTARQDKDLCE